MSYIKVLTQMRQCELTNFPKYCIPPLKKLKNVYADKIDEIMKDHLYKRWNTYNYNIKQYDRAEGKCNNHINACHGLNSLV